MKKFYLFFLFAAIAVFTAKADVQIFIVSGTVYENPDANPVPGYPVTIEIPSSNVFEGYFSEVFTNDTGEYIDEVEVPEALLQAEVFVSTIDCNGEIMTEVHPFYQGLLTINCDFVICDEPFPDCWAMWDWQPSPNDPFTIMFFDESFFSSDVVEWFWQFGDGSGSDEQNPVHTFGGPGVYPVCLTIATPDCEDTFCMDMIVEEGWTFCQAMFEYEHTANDSLSVAFYDTSWGPGEFSWFWDFGDGTGSEDQNPVHFYGNPGLYPVCLTIISGDCTDEYCAEVFVGYNPPECEAFFTWQQTPNGLQSIMFFDASTGPGEFAWLWEFGDGTVSDVQNPVHFYEIPGIYEVCLMIISGDCQDVFCAEVNVGFNPPDCDAFFEWQPMSNDSLSIAFFDASWGPGEFSWSWSFGDGSGSDEQNPVHYYGSPGIYEVCLTIISGDCMDEFCTEVFVGFIPPDCEAFFEWIPMEEQTIMFMDLSNPPPTEWYWDFGDNTFSDEPVPIHYYEQPGQYVVCLTIFNEEMNCEDTFCQDIWVEGGGGDCQAYYTWWPMDDLTVEFMDLSTFEPGEWVWEFGDGQMSWEPNPVHNYGQPGVYPVCLTIYSGNCMDVYCEDVIVEGVPSECHADFWWNMMDELNVQFNNTSYPDSSEFIWEFGDGTTSNEINPVHQYEEPGVYEVCLVVFNPELNCEDILCQEVWVGNNFECQAFFEWEPLSDSGFIIQFYDGSIGPDDLSYFWEFGDGGISEDKNPIHIYQEPGFFEVCLTISSPDCQDVFCNEVLVEGYNWNCIAEFDFQINEDLNVQFVDWSYPTPEEWLWEFGDGTTSTDQNPTHQYQEPGVFEVCLTIINGFVGCEDMVCHVVDFENTGGMNASFEFIQDSTNFFTLYFFDTSTGNPMEWMWEFGDGTMSNEQNPVHSFNGPGIFVVCLSIFDETGEASTYCEEIILDGSFISTIDEPGNDLSIKSIFPNPANKFINLKIDSQENAMAGFVLVNLQGMAVKRNQHNIVRGENHIRFDVSDVAEGIYLLRVQHGNSISTAKIKISK